MNEHDRLVSRAARDAHTVLFIGGLESGKSTLARATGAFALRLGRTVAYLDADVAQKTVGPPATVGLKHIHEADDLTFDRHGRRRRPGVRGLDQSPGPPAPAGGRRGAAARRAPATRAPTWCSWTPAARSRASGASWSSTTRSTCSSPIWSWACSAARSSSPSLGVIQRFFGIDVEPLTVHANVETSSVEQRMEQRERSMARYFGGDLQRFRVKPTVFMPTLPPLFDLAQLDRLLVGLSDGQRRVHGPRVPGVRARRPGAPADLARGRAPESA